LLILSFRLQVTVSWVQWSRCFRNYYTTMAFGVLIHIGHMFLFGDLR
jgi:hypothetical protein